MKKTESQNVRRRFGRLGFCRSGLVALSLVLACRVSLEERGFQSALSQEPASSQPAAHEQRPEEDADKPRVLNPVWVPMRDGVRLATTVWIPAGKGSFPVLLLRSPYGKGFNGEHYNNLGYVLVAQDCRGRYESEGEFYPFTQEGSDGLDTLKWIHRQAWCNGKVGMFGNSYLAATQFYLAPLAGDLLTALNPCFMGGDLWQHVYYCDGAFSLALTYTWAAGEVGARTSRRQVSTRQDFLEFLRSRPLMTLDERGDLGVVDGYRDYLRHDRYDEFWQGVDFRKTAAKVRTPMLLIGGWYDYYAGETFANYRALRQQAPDPALADAHRVIVGPWTHGLGASRLGELDFGAESRREADATIRWMNCLLRDGSTPKDFQEAPIRLFVMGINRWRDEWEWPLARARRTDFYLHSTGRAAETSTDGTLVTEAPTEDEPPDAFTYDPADPVPTWGGNHSIGPWNPGLYQESPPGPFDQRKVESRQDVLLYTTKPLEEDLEVTGPVTVTLYAASSARDTDFVARLCDVHPDGRSINVTEGILRARFRSRNWSKPAPIEPGRTLKYTIEMQPTSIVFARGHCIRLHITSSCFPLWDPNPNTGGPIATEIRLERARQTIYHSRSWPSCVRLPVIPQEEPKPLPEN